MFGFMIYALHSELFRLRQRPQSRVMLGLIGFFVGLYYAIIYAAHIYGDMTTAKAAEEMAPASLMTTAMQMFGFFGLILIVIMASGLIGAEYGWNTLRPLVARAQTRAALLSAKWITVVVFTALVTVVAVASAVLFSVVGSVLIGADVSVSVDLLAYILQGTACRFVAILPYPIIAFAVALLTRSNAAGIAIGSSLRFVEPLAFDLLTGVSGVFEQLQQWGLAWNVQLLNRFDGDAVTDGDLWRASAVLVAYCSGCVVVTYLVFSRRDITSG